MNEPGETLRMNFKVLKDKSVCFRALNKQAMPQKINTLSGSEERDPITDKGFQSAAWELDPQPPFPAREAGAQRGQNVMSVNTRPVFLALGQQKVNAWFWK